MILSFYSLIYYDNYQHSSPHRSRVYEISRLRSSRVRSDIALWATMTHGVVTRVSKRLLRHFSPVASPSKCFHITKCTGEHNQPYLPCFETLAWLTKGRRSGKPVRKMSRPCLLELVSIPSDYERKYCPSRDPVSGITKW